MTEKNISPEARQDIERFVHALGFCKPLFFASGSEAFPYYCGGTCFLVRYQGKIYVLTAKHCLREDPEFVYVLTNDQKLVPVRRQVNPREHGDDSAWADVCCLTTYPDALPDLAPNDCFDFDEIARKDVSGNLGQALVLKAYPYSLFEMTSENRLVRSPTLHMGLYAGPTESQHCHYFLVEYPDLGDPNGMSGAPVVKMDYDSMRGAYPTVVGMILQGSSAVRFLRFVSVEVLVRLVHRVQTVPF